MVQWVKATPIHTAVVAEGYTACIHATLRLQLERKDRKREQRAHRLALKKGIKNVKKNVKLQAKLQNSCAQALDKAFFNITRSFLSYESHCVAKMREKTGGGCALFPDAQRHCSRVAPRSGPSLVVLAGDSVDSLFHWSLMPQWLINNILTFLTRRFFKKRFFVCVRGFERRSRFPDCGTHLAFFPFFLQYPSFLKAKKRGRDGRGGDTTWMRNMMWSFWAPDSQ